MAKKEIDIKTIEDLLAWMLKHDPEGAVRWRLEVYQPWSKTNDNPCQYSLCQTGSSGWSRTSILSISPETGEALRPYWRTNPFKHPIGSLKITGILKRWDDDYGTDLLEQAKVGQAVAQVEEDRRDGIRWLRDLQQEAEMLTHQLQRDLPKGVIRESTRKQFLALSRDLYDQAGAGIDQLSKPEDDLLR